MADAARPDPDKASFLNRPYWSATLGGKPFAAERSQSFFAVEEAATAKQIGQVVSADEKLVDLIVRIPGGHSKAIGATAPRANARSFCTRSWRRSANTPMNSRS